MIKTTQVKNASSNWAAKKNLACWSKPVRAQSLRVELADGGFFLFPYEHHVFVKFEPRDDRDHLTVRLTTHIIQITGRNLRELGLAFQKDSVEWIREIPERYLPLADEDGVRIEDIEVKENQRRQ
jgi:hypothetical protein